MDFWYVWHKGPQSSVLSDTIGIKHLYHMWFPVQDVRPEVDQWFVGLWRRIDGTCGVWTVT